MGLLPRSTPPLGGGATVLSSLPGRTRDSVLVCDADDMRLLPDRARQPGVGGGPTTGDALAPRLTSTLGWLRAAVIAVLTIWAAVVVVAGDHRPLLLSVVAVTAVSTLWLQPRHPLVTLAAAFGGLAIVGVLGFPGPDDPFLALIVWSCYGVGRHAPRRHQPWAAAASLFFVSINLLGADVQLPGDFVFPVLFAAAPWILGLTVQLARTGERRASEASIRVLESRDAMVTQATVQERLRIARELHDVAAHSMSAVSLQAQVLRRRLEAGGQIDPTDARQIETTARQALDELRHVVGVLRPSSEAEELTPQPSMKQLDLLVDRCRSAGQHVELTTTGEASPIPEGLSLCAYRITQEALANARQHGGPGRVDVAVHWEPDALSIRVANPLGRPSVDARQGHGLIGMRERAALFGGRLDAAPDGGHWVVEALLPFQRSALVAT